MIHLGLIQDIEQFDDENISKLMSDQFQARKHLPECLKCDFVNEFENLKITATDNNLQTSLIF